MSTFSAQLRNAETGRWTQVKVWSFAEQSSIAWMDRAEALAAVREWIAQFEGRHIVIEEFGDDGIVALGKVAEIGA